MNVTCLCGGIELEISGEPIVQMYCHCDDCQAVHGAAYVPESVYNASDVKVVRGEPTAWALLRSPRVTCPTCGTRLFIDVVKRKLRGVNGNVLPRGEFHALFHVQCRFAQNPVKDDLPHYAGMPAQFGGSDETVDW